MTTGKQLAALLLLTSALTFPGAASAQGTVGDAGTGAEGLPPADADSADTVSDQADEAAAEDGGPEISVPGGNTIIVTGRINRDPTRNAAQVINVLSTEQIARTGEGDIAGALGRVTGLSVVGNGLVYVRGLGDRYSLALLNGLPLPSPEPLSRVIPLDIFPTNVVESSLVQKTYSANFPGEFGGGVINLTTQAVPDESFLTITGGVSADTITTFQRGYSYFGGDADWTGFDDGHRDIPGPLADFFDQSINNGLSVDDPEFNDEALARTLMPPKMGTLQRLSELYPNFSGGITAGTAVDVGSDGRLGIVFTGGMSHELRNRDISRQLAGPNSSSLQEDFTRSVTDSHTLTNAMLGIGYEFGENTIRFTNLFIRDTVKQASLENGTDTIQPTYNYQTQNTAWYERQLIDSQAVGEFQFGSLGVDVRGGYAKTQREAPFNLTYDYIQTNLDSDPFGDYYRIDFTQSLPGFTRPSASFSDLNEELWYGGLDLSYEVTPTLVGTVGYAYTDTQRYSERREFEIAADIDPNFAGDALPPGTISNETLQYILQAVGLRQPSLLLNDATFNMFDVNLIDNNELDPAFEAGLRIHAGYGQFQWKPIDAISIQAGVRYEDAVQTTTPIGALNQAEAVRNAQDYWLPSATLTWEAGDGLQFRLAGSRTIARPQFRELVLQRYDDPETQRSYTGNPYLTDSKLLNLEARAEYYLDNQSRVSLAGFYKKIDNPIEVYIVSSAAERITSFANAPEATLYGAEADIQYVQDLIDLGDAFMSKQLVLVGNYTYTNSELSVSDDDETTIVVSNNPVPVAANQYFNDGAPLIGQSDHLVNFQIGLEDVDVLQQFTVLFSYASERVSFRGANQLPDVIEDPGLRVDLVARQGFQLLGTESELKLQARNIFGRGHQEYQVNSTGLRFEANTYDVGTTISASLSVKL